MDDAEIRAKLDRAAQTNSLMQDDLGDLLRALGMFDGARPQSPHEVMRDAIDVARHMRRELEWYREHH